MARLLVDPAKAAARVRAALAYANIEVKQAPNRPGLRDAGITYAILTRIVSPTSPRGADIEELWAIADECKVPRPFMEHGWEFAAATQEDQDTGARLLNVETQLASLVRSDERIDELQAQVLDLRSQMERLTQQALERRQRDVAQRERQRRGTTRENGDVGDAPKEER